MISVLANRDYARLFGAQVVALLGTGLLTVALSLLAFDLAGSDAGSVLGTALAIKMVAYVVLAPLATALVAHLPRKAVLIGADLVRASVALALPLVDQIWQIYVLIFVLQAASATFTPAFQAIIPDILTREQDYTRALSLSRLAYELENLASPVLAALLLTVISFHWLFLGTVLGFVGSALLVLLARIPRPDTDAGAPGFSERLTRGIRIYLATPRLRGLLGVTLCAAAASAMVLVNTVVIVRGVYGGTQSDLALAMAAYGFGAMLGALLLPGLLDRVAERGPMLAAAVLLGATCLAGGVFVGLRGWPTWSVFLGAMAFSGALFSVITTPSGRLLQRSAQAADRPALFAAQFALSHACWLLTYPLAGWVGAGAGMAAALVILGGVGLAGAVLAARLWPDPDPLDLDHEHGDLPGGHPHLAGARGKRHRHAYRIDAHHRNWPSQR